LRLRNCHGARLPVRLVALDEEVTIEAASVGRVAHDGLAVGDLTVGGLVAGPALFAAAGTRGSLRGA
jgi:hypothetical protein